MGGAAGNTTAAKAARGLLSNLAGGGAAGGGTKTPKGTVEAGVAAAAGAGASSGLPTCSDTGAVKMTFHQVNQDGAGPLTAAIDPTSGGTDPAAFKAAQVTQNVPGSGVGGLSTTTTTDFPVTIQMPAGMVCSGTLAGVSNVCIARMQNSALAGPFGGSVTFTQPPAAKKRAIEYNLSKRRFARLVRNAYANLN
jgi:Egh16-like virulence factor